MRLFETDIDKFNVKLDGRVNDRLSVFGRYGYRDSFITDEPTIPLPSGGSSNGEIYGNNKQLAVGATYTPGGTQLFEFRFGWSRTRGGKDPLSLGTPGAQEAYGLPGLPIDDRVAGGLPTQIVTGFSDFGRQSTNPQWQYPEVWNPKINYSFVRGKQSIKVGYEFQHVQTEVQDVNPLYGRDAYAGQFTRPTTSAANNLYNLSDFYFGLRAQYALSNILVANLRQNMHFLYVQDDYRVNDKLTLNLGVRYEYATPWYERDNILTNFDPATRTMIAARDGSVEDRSTIEPDRNNFGPRLGFAYSITPDTVIRGGFGTSFVHFQRAGGGNVLPINGPQVVNAVVSQLDPTAASFRTTEQGYPEGLTDPTRFNPLAANITYMPRDYHSSRVNSYFISAQREFFRNTIVDVAYVGNRADGTLLFANFNQARPNAPGENLSLQARRPIQEFADITYAWNGGKSQYDGFQARVETRLRGLYILNALTLSRTKDNGAGSLENQNGNFADAAGHQQSRRGIRAVGLSPAVQHDQQRRVGTAVRARSEVSVERLAAGRRARRRLAGGVRQHLHGGRSGDVHLHAGGAGAGLGHRRRLPRREQLSPEPDRRSLRRPRAPRPATSIARRSRCPIRRSRSATPAATPCAARTSGRSTSRWRSASSCRSARTRASKSAARRSICSTA